MFAKLGLAIVIATYVSSTSALPPCTCTRNLRPVCGSDGHTYANQCLLECEVSKGKSITVAKEGQCDGDTFVQPVCICTYEYKPVCGTDGKTYPNSCALDCEKAKKADLAIERTGACESIPQLPPPCTICPANYLPVCASNGKSYPNSCVFDCDKSKDATLKIVRQGTCESVNVVNNVEQQDCTCGYSYLPLCGSDGKDYSNMCTLECAQKKDPSLTVARSGRCDGSSQVLDITVPSAAPPTSVCTCTRNLKQVCGSDGQTYANQCLLECEVSKGKSITVTKEGPCEADETASLPSALPPCTCTRNLRPVCGSDGQTYANQCLLECEVSKGKSITVTKEGPCEADETASLPSALPPCTCTRNLRPVCGSDGQTYANQCLLECEVSKGKSITVTKEGPCEADETASLPSALPPCTCTRNLRPVCGSDGQTYANQCLLECEVSKGKSITLEKEGQCDGDLAALPICICTYEYKPVCGTDGKTYPNSCALDCEKAKKADLAIERTGACESVPQLPPPCTICPANYLPVCASNGKSYPNSCVFDCDKSKDATLKIVRQGTCESVNVVNNVEQQDCTCGYSYLPLCGSDGKDYSNMCTLECAQKKDPSLTVARSGRCDGTSQVLDITVPSAAPPTLASVEPALRAIV